MIRRKEPVCLPRIVIMESDIDSPLKQMQLLVKSYFDECSLIKKNNRSEYYNRFYGLGKYVEHNLNEVGIVFQVTRERVRQIITESDSNLRKLINGDVVLTPRTVYDLNYTTRIRNFIAEIQKNSLMTHKEIVALLKPENSIEESFIYPLMGLSGFVKNEHNGLVLYRCKDLTMESIRSLTNKIDKFLRKEILPVPIEKISKSLKKPDDLVLSLMKLMPHVVSEEKKYYIHDHSLYSVKDLVYRIFHEKRKELSLNDIKTELKKRGIALPICPNLGLPTDKRFQCVGKTGVWGLREWNIDSAHLYDVMLDALRFLGKPATVAQLISCIKNRRPGVRNVTIYNYLNHYKHLFCFFDGGLIAPAEDRKKYKNLKVKKQRNIKRHASQHQVDKILVDYLKIKKSATARELYNEVKKYHQYSWNGFYARLTKSPYLTYCANDFPRKYKLKDKIIIVKDEKKELKSDKVRKEIIQILQRTKGFSMPLPKLISKVTAKTGCQKPFIYKVVSNTSTIATETSKQDIRTKNIKLLV